MGTCIYFESDEFWAAKAHNRNQLKLLTSTIAMEYEEASSSNGDSMWTQIPFRELTVCEVLAGGGVALVHRGIYRKNSVALKTLVSSRETNCIHHRYLYDL